MKCSIPGCLVSHEITVIDEHNIWDVYESFSDSAKPAVLRRWLALYQSSDSDFAKSVVKKCQELLEAVK